MVKEKPPYIADIFNISKSVRPFTHIRRYNMKSKSSYVLAGVIAVAVTGWMMSDNIFGGSDDTPSDAGVKAASTAAGSATGDKSISVVAVRVKNEMITRTVRASGVSEAKFEMTVSAKSDGQIIAIDGREGSDIMVGDVIVRLDEGTLVEQIAAAKANLEVAQKRSEVTERLAAQNFSAPLEQAERAATLATARVNLRQLEEQLEDKIIIAPVSGHLETVHVETGERVRRDTATATILGLDTLSVVVAVPQTKISQITIDSPVDVKIAGDQSRRGVVAKIAAKSNAATRTFDVTIDLPNTDRALRAGMSVEATIDAGAVSVFAMSPAHLSVAENGALTTKIVVDGKVKLTPVELVRSGSETVFVSGLPDAAILLTVGQAFVSDGSMVSYQLDSGS